MPNYKGFVCSCKFTAHDSDCVFNPLSEKWECQETLGSPVPSGPPTPYSISIGWKASDVDLGIYGEGPPPPLAEWGNALTPVGMLKFDSGTDRVMDWTVTRWSRQCVGVIEDVLRETGINFEAMIEEHLTYAAKIPDCEWTSNVDRPFGWMFHDCAARSGPRKSHNLTSPSKLYSFISKGWIECMAINRSTLRSRTDLPVSDAIVHFAPTMHDQRMFGLLRLLPPNVCRTLWLRHLRSSQ